LYDEVGAFAKQGQPIVIFGPTGSGKEFLARHYYRTFINTDYYKESKNNWPSNYNKIKNEYSSRYSGKSLDIFLNSLRVGIFQSINAATIYPNLAESILFGHEEGTFNEARTSPGLLESIKYGVLFMDEVGELPKNLQAKFLRAVDSEIHEGRRIGGKINYSVKDLIIITATNQPREKLRKDFYYKLGIDVEIKGIDERPNDVRKSIPHFLSKAIGKRKDRAAIVKMFGIEKLSGGISLSEISEVRNFAKEQSALVIDKILTRKWPGNFRALRIALEASIFRIESADNLKNFSQEFRNYFNHYKNKYSLEASNISIPVGKSVRNFVYPSSYPDIDGRIFEKINNENVLTNLDDYEKSALAVFLSSTHKTGFKRRDLEEHYKKYDSIKYTSQSNIRNKLNQLITLNFLIPTGMGKSTKYHLTDNFLESIEVKKTGIFSLPKIKSNWIDRDREIELLGKVLLKIDRVYIQAPPRYGKSAFMAMFCKSREKQYNFYYYALGQDGIKKFIEDIAVFLSSKNIVITTDKSSGDYINKIQPFLNKLFKTKDEGKPVLILDNVHFISDPDDKRLIAELSKKWKEIILILIGNKMDNIFLEEFYEFNLSPWGKQT
jgi:DNA-binding NtrC family response regulator